MPDTIVGMSAKVPTSTTLHVWTTRIKRELVSKIKNAI